MNPAHERAADRHPQSLRDDSILLVSLTLVGYPQFWKGSASYGQTISRSDSSWSEGRGCDREIGQRFRSIVHPSWTKVTGYKNAMLTEAQYSE